MLLSSFLIFAVLTPFLGAALLAGRFHGRERFSALKKIATFIAIVSGIFTLVVGIVTFGDATVLQFVEAGSDELYAVAGAVVFTVVIEPLVTGIVAWLVAFVVAGLRCKLVDRLCRKKRKKIA